MERGGVEPVLAAGRGRHLLLQRVSVDADGRRRPALRFRLPFDLRGVQWFDERTLALLDARRRVHVVDVDARRTLDVVDISGLGLVPSQRRLDDYSGSFLASAGQVLLLCGDGLRSQQLRTREERLDLLVSRGRYDDALRLGLR